MANFKLNKNTFNEAQFNKVIDTEFHELKESRDPKFFDTDMATLKDFFKLYNSLFFDIPSQGDIDSHREIAIRSGERSGYNLESETISDLEDELEDLRKENAELRQEIVTILQSAITENT